MSANKKIRRNRYKKKPKVHGSTKVYPILQYTGGAAVLGLLSLFLIFIYGLLVQSDYFRIRNIDIHGAGVLSKDQIESQSGIHPGRNILSVNLALARMRLIAHPWIADADIERILPWDLVIHVKEHVPLACLDMGRKFLMDTKGNVFKEVHGTFPASIPFVKGLSYADLKEPEKAPGKPLKDVLSILKLNEFKKLKSRGIDVKRIDVDKDLGITLHSEGIVKEVILGCKGFRTNLTRLMRVLLYAGKVGGAFSIASLDLSNPDRMVMRPTIAVSTADNKKEV